MKRWDPIALIVIWFFRRRLDAKIRTMAKERIAEIEASVPVVAVEPREDRTVVWNNLIRERDQLKLELRAARAIQPIGGFTGSNSAISITGNGNIVSVSDQNELMRNTTLGERADMQLRAQISDRSWIGQDDQPASAASLLDTLASYGRQVIGKP